VSAENVMFLAHFSHTPLDAILQWPSKKIQYWYVEADKLFKKMYPDK
jgi:hypothetical protein